ncbi:MAG: hypothetical protein AAF311_00565 [Pseudomonadota bacterium]
MTRLSAILLFVFLSACAGFQPMHGTAETQTAFSDMVVEVGDGGDEGDRMAGFLIRQRLADRMSRNDAPTYKLTIAPSSQRVGIGLTGQDFATRFDGVVTAEWSLVRLADGAQVASGRARSVATYSADQDPYRLQSTSDQATQRAARDVADQLLQQVALELADAS